MCLSIKRKIPIDKRYLGDGYIHSVLYVIYLLLCSYDSAHYFSIILVEE